MNITRKTIEKDLEYLRQKSKEVELNDKSLNEDIKLLEDFCVENECLALAAVQIGIPKRLIYLSKTDLNKIYDKEYNENIVMINPVIIEAKGKTKYWEACASCLDNTGLVTRPYKIKLEYYDINGIKHIEDIEGFKSTVICHEIDHLNGILHIDIAEEILQMNKEERKAFREAHPYEIISKE